MTDKECVTLKAYVVEPRGTESAMCASGEKDGEL